MRKIEALLALALLVVSTAPAFAEDQGQSVGAAGDAGVGKRKHQGNHHGGRGRAAKPPGKRQVMGLSDLTDKQKSQLEAIYDAKKPQFANLRKQMEDLEAGEWQDVQGVLTPAQVQTLSGGAASAPGGQDKGGGND